MNTEGKGGVGGFGHRCLHWSALMPRMSESEVFVGLPGVDIKSQDAALLVMLVAPWCVQGTYKPLRRGGDGPNVRELRVRPTLCPTSYLASGLLVGEFSNLLSY